MTRERRGSEGYGISPLSAFRRAVHDHYIPGIRDTVERMTRENDLNQVHDAEMARQGCDQAEALEDLDDSGLTDSQRRLLEAVSVHFTREEIERVVAEERSTKEEKSMSVDLIRMETGTLRQGTNLSARIWFVFVTPTGAEVPLTKAGVNVLKKNWGRQRGGFSGSTQITIFEYEVLKPCRIKMCNNVSAFGKGTKFVNLFIDLDPDVASVEFHGLEEHGLFQGRGAVDYEHSFITERGVTEPIHLDEATVKQYFGLRMLQPPRHTGRTSKMKVRAIIY